MLRFKKSIWSFFISVTKIETKPELTLLGKRNLFEKDFFVCCFGIQMIAIKLFLLSKISREKLAVAKPRRA